MPKALKTPELVSWHDNPLSGHAKGLITQHVKQPFYVDIDPRGAWVLHTLDKQDKPRFVDKGQAKTVTKAKADATAAALAKVPELKAALAISDPMQVTARQLEPVAISGRRATIRLYAFTTALILWALWLFYLWLRHQPLAATLAAITLAVGLYLAHRTLKLLDAENARRERLTKRKQLSQAKAIASQHMPQAQVKQLSSPQHKALARRL